MKCLEARFIISAVRPEQFPREELPEIAFLGRSNVGKSSLLNALVGTKGLAYTSGTPGRTRAVTFYSVGGRWLFVDLPGYGYARVPKETARSWKFLIEEYLLHRKTLALCLLLVDARRGWMRKDLDLANWLRSRNRRFMVIATKFDKLTTQKERRLGLAAIREHSPEAGPVPFSAVTGQGAREIWQTILKTKSL